jgi:hypothetical protein
VSVLTEVFKIIDRELTVLKSPRRVINERLDEYISNQQSYTASGKRRTTIKDMECFRKTAFDYLNYRCYQVVQFAYEIDGKLYGTKAGGYFPKYDTVLTISEVHSRLKDIKPNFYYDNGSEY